MKRSKVVALVAIGVGPLALAACDRRPECRQGEPQTQDCRPASSSHSGGSGGAYIGSSTSGAMATTSGEGEAATARGGFGGTGEAASGGGHGGGEGGGGHGGGGGGE